MLREHLSFSHHMRFTDAYLLSAALNDFRKAFIRFQFQEIKHVTTTLRPAAWAVSDFIDRLF